MEYRGQSPTLKLGDACLLVPWGLILLFLPEESATTTSSDQDVNMRPSLHLLVGPPHDITDDLNQGTLNWRSPNTGVGKAAPQWRVRSFLETRSFIIKMTGPNRTLAFSFSLHLPHSPRCSVSAPRNQHQLLSLPSDSMFNPLHSPLGSTSLSTPSPTISPFPLQIP